VHVIEKVAIPVIVVFAVVLGVAAWGTSTMEPLSETEQWFQGNHWAARAMGWLEDEFPLSERDSTVIVDMTWGVLGIDRDGTSAFDPADRGTAILDPSFEPSCTACQQFILDTCNGATNVRQYRRIHSCFMQDFADWRAANGEAFPVVANATQTQTEAFTLAMTTWLTGDGRRYADAGRVGLDGSGRIRLMQVAWETEIELFEPYAINKPVYDAFEEYTQQRNAAAPDGVNQAVQTADISWQWMMTERALIRSAISGMALSISVAFIVLVLATMNTIVGAYATIAIIGIVLSVMATMAAQGWQMGVSESVSSVILIGFSVDYTVHLAVAYVESRATTRKGKTQDALAEMGISVTAGAVTTFGAGVFLFGATIIFFRKFGILIMSTIAYSMLWALIFFPSLLVLAGPTGETGSLRPIVRAISSKFKKGDNSKAGATRDSREGDVELATVPPAEGKGTVAAV
jgi:hypothetical protein